MNSQPPQTGHHPLHRVVVVGAGFGGLTAALRLARAPVELTILDRRNHHVFQPLLYQVATAALSPPDIAVPIRSVIAGGKNTTVVLGTVTCIDLDRREACLCNRRIPYDTLIVATGARHAYSGHDWEHVAPGLKQLEDATAIRRKILIAFERAETATTREERKRLLTFVVVGAGPTGLELAGAIAELAVAILRTGFRTSSAHDVLVILVEAANRVLPGFAEELSRKAEQALERLGVELIPVNDDVDWYARGVGGAAACKINKIPARRPSIEKSVSRRAGISLGVPVTACDAEGLLVGNRRIDTQTVIWAAGVMASPTADWFGTESDSAGRVVVAPDLTLRSHPEVFVIGDTARSEVADGRALPGTAPVAKQKGAYVARVIRSRLVGRDVVPFRYRHFGSMATIGRGFAVAEFGRIRLSGFLAWYAWGIVHIAFLIGLRNRAAVLLAWFWIYLTRRHSARLITAGQMD